MKLLIIKALYKTLLSTLPIFTYNSISNLFFIPFNVQPYSTYVNFKLDNYQINILKKYIQKYTENLELYPIKILPNDIPSYFLSVNIYNCTSPIFLNKNVTRCEINTYVKDKYNNYGTLILDYCSNFLSLDPVDLFKNGEQALFLQKNNNFQYKIKNNDINFDINLKIIEKTIKNEISESLIKFTDNIFYKNGICDKLYYDSSLVKSNILFPEFYKDFSFEYKQLNLKKIHSIFLFKDRMNFICGLWHNLYNKIYSFDIK